MPYARDRIATFVVTVEMTREVRITVQAPDALEARTKAAGLEFDADTPSELIGWRVASVEESLSQAPAIISEHSALSLARDQFKTG